eukprot:CAMPEP_0174270082 /NCGR_PEP_ID=MMETSP0439-20130205/43254_1 /TAXON_ID=0 /ORGANISM="Stereomyxa ramosa, Strain Chinc5" /LENGTH=89 /DNA_ID=CAMNT_0015359205 /DNA_START=1 /DNA_END=267 /DNA_ORIENTATION=-
MNGLHFLKQIVDNIEKGRKEVVPRTGQKVIDIDYRDLVKDPVGTVKYIYWKTGLEFTQEYEDKLNTYLKDGKARRAKIGRYSRSVEDFG